MKKKICEYIDSQKESFLKDLKSLVDINSERSAAKEGMPFGDGSARALEKMSEIAALHGFEAVNFDNYALEINFGNSPELMLLAHLDVVPAGDGWTYEPYNMSVENGKIYGRGVTDDKGAALCCLYAMKAVKELFGTPKKGVRLVLGSGEETGSEDMEYYFSKRPFLPHTVSPDADYPVINIEKGRFAPTFSKKLKNGGEKRLVSFTGGDTVNIVPGKAEAKVSGFTQEEISRAAEFTYNKTGVRFEIKIKDEITEISATGTSAHASLPEKGNSASTALVSLINTLPMDKSEVSSAFESMEKLFPHGETDGKSVRIKMSDEKSGALTLNLGVLSFQNSTLSGTLDIRAPLCATHENMCNVLFSALKEHGFSANTKATLTPVHYVPTSSPIVKAALKVYEEYTGDKGECLAIGGGTYVHDIDGGIAFGPTFPGTDRNIHGADEYAETDELLLSMKMLTALITEFCD